jgi:hypothetical protein
MANEYGLVKGDVCGRNDCKGVIDEHEKEGGCSCHINPPCSYCTTDTAYCPVCDWSCDDEIPAPIDPEIRKRNEDSWAEMRAKEDARIKSFFKKYNGMEPVTEFETMYQGHTHFSMKKLGVFVKGTETRATIEEKVKGTFGGRFEFFNEDRGSFCYIAYTD